MDLKIDVTTSDSCKVIVQDISEYLPEDYQGIVKGKFKFSDTVSIDVLQHNKIKGEIYRNPVYNTTTTITEVPVDFDGWFTVVHIVLPSKDWFNTELNKQEGSTLSTYSLVYFSDGNTIYKYTNSNIEEATIDEVIEVNSTNSTISRVQEDYVSICFLRKCYINLCQQIFNDRGFSHCFDRNKVDSDLIFRRDLVWMAINVIKYLTECNQLAEVERIIEIIKGCNSLCSNDKYSMKSYAGCNCR